MRAQTSVSKAYGGSARLTLRICLSAAKHDLAMAVTMFVVFCTESSEAVLINALPSEAVIGAVPKSGFRLR